MQCITEVISLRDSLSPVKRLIRIHKKKKEYKNWNAENFFKIAVVLTHRITLLHLYGTVNAKKQWLLFSAKKLSYTLYVPATSKKITVSLKG